jgi:hypothetical protein
MLARNRRVNMEPLLINWGVIFVEDWAEIRRLYRAEETPMKAIARHLGVGKDTWNRALATMASPRYQRPARGSAVDEFEQPILALLAEFPHMLAAVIAERVGWTRSITVLRDGSPSCSRCSFLRRSSGPTTGTVVRTRPRVRRLDSPDLKSCGPELKGWWSFEP